MVIGNGRDVHRAEGSCDREWQCTTHDLEDAASTRAEHAPRALQQQNLQFVDRELQYPQSRRCAVGREEEVLLSLKRHDQNQNMSKIDNAYHQVLQRTTRYEQAYETKRRRTR